MKTLTAYHERSGTVTGRCVVDDDAEMGAEWYDGEVDPRTTYVRPDGTLGTRTTPVGLAVDKRILAADGVDTATISGLPDPCWLRVNGEFREVAGDVSVALTADAPSQIVVEIVGAYVAPRLVVQVVDAVGIELERNAQWTALRDATPAQIDTWLTNNVTNIAQARAVLKLLLLAVRKLRA